jgi:WD40 repeat protein
VEAAACILAGRAAAGIVSARVTALAEGVVKAMFVSKLKSVIPALVLGGALIAGTLVLVADGLAGRPALPSLAAAQPPEAPAPAPGDAEKPKAGRKPVIARENAQVLHVAWSGDGKVVAAVCVAYEILGPRDDGGEGNILVCNSAVKLWDAQTGELKKTLADEKKTYLSALALSPDGKLAAIGGFRQGTERPEYLGMRIVDTETGAVKQELDDVPGAYALAFSPDGKTLAVGGMSGRAEKGSYVQLWDVPGGKMKGGTTLAAQEAPGNEAEWGVHSLAFSPDGKLLAAGEYGRRSERAQVELYDVPTGEPKQVWEIGDTKGIFQLAFAADGKSLVSACGPVKRWDVRNGKQLATFDTRGLLTYSLAVSPDGRYLATDGVRKEKE